MNTVEPRIGVLIDSELLFSCNFSDKIRICENQVYNINQIHANCFYSSKTSSWKTISWFMTSTGKYQDYEIGTYQIYRYIAEIDITRYTAGYVNL